MKNKLYIVNLAPGILFSIGADSPEDALATAKKIGNHRRVTGETSKHGHTNQLDPDSYYVLYCNPDTEALQLSDVVEVIPENNYGLDLVGCDRCGSEYDNNPSCTCGAKPCRSEGCDGYHCKRCMSHTVDNCNTCDGCDIWDEKFNPDGDVNRRHKMAHEEMKENPFTSSDAILKLFGLEG